MLSETALPTKIQKKSQLSSDGNKLGVKAPDAAEEMKSFLAAIKMSIR